MISAAAAKASSPHPQASRRSHLHWLGQSRWRCPSMLCVIARWLTYRPLPASLSFRITLCCAPLGHLARNGRKGGRTQGIGLWICEKDKPQAHESCLQDTNEGNKSLSEKNYFLENTNKISVEAVRRNGLDTMLTWGPVPALPVLAVPPQGIPLSALNPVFPF